MESNMAYHAFICLRDTGLYTLSVFKFRSGAAATTAGKHLIFSDETGIPITFPTEAAARHAVKACRAVWAVQPQQFYIRTLAEEEIEKLLLFEPLIPMVEGDPNLRTPMVCAYSVTTTKLAWTLPYDAGLPPLPPSAAWDKAQEMVGQAYSACASLQR